jgi:hypothetical protein
MGRTTFWIAGASSIRDGRTLVVGTVVRSDVEELFVELLDEPELVDGLLDACDEALGDDVDEPDEDPDFAGDDDVAAA